MRRGKCDSNVSCNVSPSGSIWSILGPWFKWLSCHSAGIGFFVCVPVKRTLCWGAPTHPHTHKQRLNVRHRQSLAAWNYADWFEETAVVRLFVGKSTCFMKEFPVMGSTMCDSSLREIETLIPSYIFTHSGLQKHIHHVKSNILYKRLFLKLVIICITH